MARCFLLWLAVFVQIPVQAAPGAGGDLIAQAPSQYATLDGLSIHYKVVGNRGPVTLLVHGGGCDLTFWELQVPALAATGRVLLLDLPGYGQSSAPGDIRYSMKLYAQAINAVMEAAEVDRFTGEQTPAWGVEKVNASMKHARRYVVRSFFTEMSHPDTAYNDSIEVPLLAVYAQNTVWTDEVQETIRGFNDRTKFVMLPEVSHFLMLDVPGDFNSLLQRFLTGLGRDPAETS